MRPLAPLPPVPNQIKVRMSGTTQTTPFQHLFHMAWVGGNAPLAGDLNSVASQIGAAWVSALAPIHATTVTISLIECMDISSFTGATGSSSTARVGTRTGTAMPANVAAVGSYRVNYHWRGGHGRIYMPAGVTADTVNGKSWAPAFITLAGTALSSWLTALNAVVISGTPYNLTVVRYQGHAEQAPFPKSLPVTSTAFHSRIDTQRRRLGKELG